jgi:two-component system nitrate/nitrite response regulator NarL
MRLRVSTDVRRGERVHDGGVGTRLLIVDDHDGFRSWARVLFEGAGFDVVGEAPDGTSGLEAMLALRPEVVLLDVQLPDLDGFEVLRRLRERPYPPRVVLTSTREAADYGGEIDEARVPFVSKADLSGSTLRAALEGRA